MGASRGMREAAVIFGRVPVGIFFRGRAFVVVVVLVVVVVVVVIERSDGVSGV